MTDLQTKRSVAISILFLFDDGAAVKTPLRSLEEVRDDEIGRRIVSFTLPDVDLATKFVPGRAGHLVVTDDNEVSRVRNLGRMVVMEVLFGHTVVEYRASDGHLELAPTFKITLIPVEE